MKRTTRNLNIPALVEALIEAGAVFRRSPGGAWVVEGLASLPCALRDEFFAADEKALGAHLHALEDLDRAAAAQSAA